MRILKIVSSHDKGGVFSCEMQFIKGLKKKDVAVDLIILGDGDKVAQYRQVSDNAYVIPMLDASYGGPLYSICYGILKSISFGYRQSAYLGRKIGGQKGYDAILYQRPVFIHLVGRLSKHLGVKGYWHMPNAARTRFSRNYYNYFCKKYGIVQLANSTYTRNTLAGHCKYVVYPGFDGMRIVRKAPAIRSRLGIAADAPVYGVAARIHEDKALDIVVEAFVRSDVPAAGGHLLIAGGPLDTDFAVKAQKLAGPLLQQQVHFLGEIDCMPEFYSSTDIFINGRRNVEPFGISVAEAMGAGKPVIAYNLGGPAEMIADEQSGWLVNKPSVESYKERLNASLANRHRWLEMGALAKELSHTFTLEKNVKLLLDIIHIEEGNVVVSGEPVGA